MEAAGDGPAYVVATAAARHRPELAVRNAQAWFGGLGLDVEELPATTRTLREVAGGRRAGARGPVLLPRRRRSRDRAQRVLADTPVWAAIVEAWRAGAALGGSSAGAMALGAWTLIRDRMPGDERRRYRPALGLVPRIAVVPHLDAFGGRWIDGAIEAMPQPDAVLVGLEERTAAVWAQGVWRAFGPGAVEVITASARTAYRSGEVIEGIPEPA